jgi:cytochrome P450
VTDMTARPASSLRETSDIAPYDFYDARRDAGAVSWDEQMHAWLVTSYEACKYIERNEEVLFRHAYLDIGADTFVEVEGGPRNLLFLAGENHAGVHRLLMRMMSPATVHEWRETLIKPLTHGLIDRFAQRGTAELVHEFAELLPVRVIAAMLDLPYTDDAWVKDCKFEMDEIALFLETVQAAEDDPITQRALSASHRMNDLLMPVIRARQAGTGDDLISRMWREGPSLLPDWDEIDMRANVRILFFGGSDTTTHVLANAFHLLLTRPELQTRLREGGREAVNRFVEEALRMYGAIHFRPRVANQDVEVAGVEIKQNDMLLCVNLAANRDPQKYECPHAVAFDRPSPRDHLAFHSGPRTCVGAALARAELQESVAAVIERLPDLRFADGAREPQFLGFLMRSYRPLDVAFAAATR